MQRAFVGHELTEPLQYVLAVWAQGRRLDVSLRIYFDPYGIIEC
jgi:hypothetical protein